MTTRAKRFHAFDRAMTEHVHSKSLHLGMVAALLCIVTDSETIARVIVCLVSAPLAVIHSRGFQDTVTVSNLNQHFFSGNQENFRSEKVSHSHKVPHTGFLEQIAM